MNSLSSMMVEYWFLAFALLIVVGFFIYLKRKKGFHILSKFVLFFIGTLFAVTTGLLGCLSGLNYLFPSIVEGKVSIKEIEIFIGHTESDIWSLIILFTIGCVMMLIANE